MNWKNTDPRLDINKRANIVILRPHYAGYGWEAGTASVCTKEQYIVLTSFENHSLIDADSEWDSGWQWTFEPE